MLYICTIYIINTYTICIRQRNISLVFPLLSRAPINQVVYGWKSFVTPVVLIFPVGSLQLASEESLKEEGAAPVRRTRYRGISGSTKYTASELASEQTP